MVFGLRLLPIPPFRRTLSGGLSDQPCYQFLGGGSIMLPGVQMHGDRRTGQFPVPDIRPAMPTILDVAGIFDPTVGPLCRGSALVSFLPLFATDRRLDGKSRVLLATDRQEAGAVMAFLVAGALKRLVPQGAGPVVVSRLGLSPRDHRMAGSTLGASPFPQGNALLPCPFVEALFLDRSVGGDDRSDLPGCTQEVRRPVIVGRIQNHPAEPVRIAQKVSGFGQEAGENIAVVAVPCGQVHGDGEIMTPLGVGQEIGMVAHEPEVSVTVPTGPSGGIGEPTRAGTPLLLALAAFVAEGMDPGVDGSTIPGHLKLLTVTQQAALRACPGDGSQELVPVIGRERGARQVLMA